MTAADHQKSVALLAAIREYDANKWKVIGQKVGKPAKVISRPSLVLAVLELVVDAMRRPQACEQYAKEHFSGK